MLQVSIIGLPNVGKSTLFNRLIKKKAAIISNTPGTTRDRNEEIAKINDLKFKIIDTAGWSKQIKFSTQIMKQIEISLLKADIIFFVIDLKIQNEQNKELAKWIKKKTNKPVILIGNKLENVNRLEIINYLQFFNFIGPIYISAEHNIGITDLCDTLTNVIKSLHLKTLSFNIKSCSLIENCLHQKENNKLITTLNNNSIQKQQDSSIDEFRIAIVGKPNVGKSTFLNNLFKEKRLITSSEPYTTRDSISITHNYNGKLVTLIDTAGIKKKINITDKLESKFIGKSLESIKRSNVTVLILDSTIGIEQQDLSIIKIVINYRKGIIIVLNKWDLINKNQRDNLIKFIKQKKIPKLFLTVPIITISALKNINCNTVMNKCFEINKFLKKKVNTSKLNKWLTNTLNKYSHPIVKGKLIKIKYITQIGINPPTFSLICNLPKSIKENYKRYLIAKLRKNFFAKGVPIIFNFKKNKNPYTK